MFKEKTVVILGAGASRDYGLPLGDQLIHGMQEGLERGLASYRSGREDEFSIQDFSNDRYRTLFNAVTLAMDPRRSRGFLGSMFDEELLHFLQFNLTNFRDFAQLISRTHQRSIDAVLADNPRFANVGKICIALEIIHSYIAQMDTDDLDQLELHGQLSLAKSSFLRSKEARFWYPSFVEQITKEAACASDIENNNLDIVTFNYDLICEQALTTYIRASEKFLNANLQNVFRVHHVYGKIEQEIPKRSLNHDLGARLCSQACRSARKLRVVRERTEGSAELETIKRVMNAANSIFIIGFSFDDSNVSLLGLDRPGISKKIRALNFNNIASINLLLRDLGVPERQTITKSPSIHHAISDAGLFRR